MYSIRHSFQILMKLEFSRQNFEESTNFNFMKIRPMGAVLFHADRGKDRHDEGNIFVNLSESG